jgi:hypothetical protein
VTKTGNTDEAVLMLVRSLADNPRMLALLDHVIENIKANPEQADLVLAEYFVTGFLAGVVHGSITGLAPVTLQNRGEDENEAIPPLPDLSKTSVN